MRTTLLILLLNSSAQARDDGKTVKRLMYADVWKKNVVEFFRSNDLDSPRVFLVRKTLTVLSPSCSVPAVRQVLGEMFAEPAVQSVLHETGMVVACRDR